MIHLDTSFLIRALVRGSAEDARLRAWLRARAELSMSAIAWSEFLCGPLGEAQVELALRVIGTPVEFSEVDARQAAILFNSSGRRRGTLIDCMIAASALRCGAALATSNPRDFERLKRLGLGLAVA